MSHNLKNNVDMYSAAHSASLNILTSSSLSWTFVEESRSNPAGGRLLAGALRGVMGERRGPSRGKIDSGLERCG